MQVQKRGKILNSANVMLGLLLIVGFDLSNPHLSTCSLKHQYLNGGRHTTPSIQICLRYADARVSGQYALFSSFYVVKYLYTWCIKYIFLNKYIKLIFSDRVHHSVDFGMGICTSFLISQINPNKRVKNIHFAPTVSQRKNMILSFLSRWYERRKQSEREK